MSNNNILFKKGAKIMKSVFLSYYIFMMVLAIH